MPQKMKFFFSIIVPVYNTERYLSRCLNSILLQTFSSNNVEVIVVNDGSPNGYECDKIVASYKERLNINYQKLEENRGLYLARKIGVQNSVGEYILHLDSDDLFEVNALKILYDNIEAEGKVDYICFPFSIFHKNGKSGIVGYIKDIESSNVLEDMLSGKVSHNIANKCFNASFAKKIWDNMPPFYAYYNEDYYQMAILHYFAKKKISLETPLYIYVQEIGITGVKKYSKEKLRKIILSIYNVNKHLSEFYKGKNCPDYIPLVQNYSETLYADCMFNSSLKNFIDTSQDISQCVIEDICLNNVITKYIIKLLEEVASYKEKEKLIFPITMFCSFVFRYPRKNKKMCDIIEIIDNKTGTLKDTSTRNDIFEYVYYLEAELLFYKKRAKYYAPIKRVLKPFWIFYKYIFRR